MLFISTLVILAIISKHNTNVHIKHYDCLSMKEGKKEGGKMKNLREKRSQKKSELDQMVSISMVNTGELCVDFYNLHPSFLCSFER